MKDKNFRVAKICKNCKYFYSQHTSSGTKQNGYCFEPYNEHKYYIFKYVFHNVLPDDNFVKQYPEVEKGLEYIKSMKKQFHKCHKENTCDLYEEDKINSHAKRNVGDCEIEWGAYK